MNWGTADDPDEDDAPSGKKKGPTASLIIFGTMILLAALNFGLVFLMIKRKKDREQDNK